MTLHYKMHLPQFLSATAGLAPAERSLAGYQATHFPRHLSPRGRACHYYFAKYGGVLL
jgi:hypothetical protein